MWIVNVHAFYVMPYSAGISKESNTFYVIYEPEDKLNPFPTSILSA